MKLRFFYAMFAFALLMSVNTACTTISEQPQEIIAKELTTAEQKLGRELLIAFLKDDAAAFVAKLSPEIQEKFGIKEFKQTREELIKTLGEPVSFRYLTKLEFVSVEPHIWKVRFERESRKGEKIHSETLFRIITGRTDDGTILIIGFNFL